ncbi:MAG: PAS domain-containing protein, partial [Proteobacteria bacterium]|nr:PAS domain-containing protein [Pseudomonadota bacterium]
MKWFATIRVPTFVAAVGAILLLLMLQTSLALYVNYQQLENDLRNELFRGEISDAIQFQGIVEYMLQKHEFEQLQEEIAVMSIEPSVSKAIVMDHEHIILASTAYADRGRTFEELFPGLVGTGYKKLLDEAQRTQQYRTLHLNEADCWVLFQPVSFGISEGISHQQSIGFLVKKIDLLWVEQQARSGLLGRFLPTLLPLLFGAIFLAVLAYYLHTRRLATLSQLVQDISLKGVNHTDTVSSQKKTGFVQFFSGQSNKFVERKQQELTSAVEQIALREQGLSLTLDSIGDAVIVTDTAGRIVRMNPVAEELTAWNFEDAKGRPLSEIFSIVDSGIREKIDNPVVEVLSTGKVVSLRNHTLLISRDGSEYQISDSAAPIRNEDGTIRGVILVFRDNTEYYRLQ